MMNAIKPILSGVFVVFAMVNANAEDLPDAPIYGPESNSFMRGGSNWGKRLSVRPGGRVSVDVSFDAGNENAVTIYDQEGRLVYYANNKGINSAPLKWRWENRSSRDKDLYVTSWHKNHKPGKGPWYQSQMSIFRIGEYFRVRGGEAKHYLFGFEDSNVNQGNAFNDAVIRVTKFRPRN